MLLPGTVIAKRSRIVTPLGRGGRFGGGSVADRSTLMGDPPVLRRLLPVAATGLVALALLELGSWAFFRFAGPRLPIASGRRFTLTPLQIRDLKAAADFDPELGWTTRYATPFGERPRSAQWGAPWLAAFGDSFVHGDEVSHAQTWEEALAEAAGRDVLNLGVPGYGIDQALLRARRVAPGLGAPVLLLGFPLGNIGRIVSRYRPFYFRKTGLPFTKPRFLLHDDRLVLLPNPVRSVDELERLGDPDFLEEIGAEDLWFSRLPRPAFPFSSWILRPSLWRAAAVVRRRDDVERFEIDGLWRTAAARTLFIAILDAFVDESRALGRQAVIALLPGRDSIEAVRAGRDPAGRRELLEHCTRTGYACFDGVAALVEDGAARKPDPYFLRGGHPSAAANAVLARSLRELLKAEDRMAVAGR